MVMYGALLYSRVLLSANRYCRGDYAIYAQAYERTAIYAQPMLSMLSCHKTYAYRALDLKLLERTKKACVALARTLQFHIGSGA